MRRRFTTFNEFNAIIPTTAEGNSSALSLLAYLCMYTEEHTRSHSAAFKLVVDQYKSYINRTMTFSDICAGFQQYFMCLTSCLRL